jgi:hypothetical protein
MVAILLVVGLAAIGALVGLREHGSTDSFAQNSTESDKKTAGDTKKATKKSDPGAKGAPAAVDAKNTAESGTTDPKTKATIVPVAPPLDRPLRVVSLGWDLAVPAHLATNGKDGKESAFAMRKVDVEIKSVKSLKSVKSALANGGAQKGGADIAIVPLPEMVAAYEDLRALKPQIFFVAGWSRGRDAIFAHKKSSLLKLPRTGKVVLTGTRASSSMLLSLYLLDISGVDSKRIKISSKADKASMFSAIDRAKTTEVPRDSRLSVTSADASALIPFVAIAPQGFLQNRRVIAAFVDAWLEGVDQLEDDVPAAARQVSAIKGAPETLTLVRNLGLVEFSGLRDNVRRAGLAGRDPVNLASLFQLTWRLWRGVDVLTTPAPKNVPIAFEAIASLALQSAELEEDDEVEPDFTTSPLVRGTTSDLESAALVAGVFARSSLRIGAFGKKKTSANALEDLITRYGLSDSRFEAKPGLSKRKTIVLEVYSAP